MDFLSKHTACLSTWELNLAPGWQTVSAYFLLTAGSLFVASRALTFLRVILSLFVLPGKSVGFL
jgi:17beta-estradiol 17-dehydrogenase / very-long-chain 3-oxoacyl-CoA reductase